MTQFASTSERARRVAKEAAALASRSEREAADLDFRLAKVRLRYELARPLIIPLGIAATALPLLVTGWIARTLAGRHTTISVSLSVTVALVGALFALIVIYWRRTQRYQEELRCTRARTVELEEQLRELSERSQSN